MKQLSAAPALAVLTLLLPLATLAAPIRPVSWSVKSAPHSAVRPGAKFEVTLAGAIEPGWHVYALAEPDGGPIATQVGLADGDPADLLNVTSGKPRLVMDPSFGMQTGLFRNTVDFTLHLQAPKAGGTGAPTPLHVLVRYQSCDDHICLPPHTDTVDVPVTLAH
jgi:hypothetical protein